MSSEDASSPKYNVAIVEAVILELVAELHPQHLPAAGIAKKIVSDKGDIKEIWTATQAIQGLRELGLLVNRDDEIVEPTPAALRAVALLA